MEKGGAGDKGGKILKRGQLQREDGLREKDV